MPKISDFQGKTQLEIERFDGGLNTKDAPSRIDAFESPELLNVVFDDQGAVSTRLGSIYFNTSTIETGSVAIDGHASFNGTMIVWSRGSMYRASGTTFVTIASAESQFGSGLKVTSEIYQRILFCSDGTNGPYKYDGSGFYRMGIAVPSAPTGACNVTLAGGPSPGTYYYKVSYVNSQVVEGEAGSMSTGVVLTASSAVNVTSIPTGAASLGVNARRIYRASTTSGPWRMVGSISGNAISIFTDTMAATTWSVQQTELDDATAPTPFTTLKLHKERLFFDDSSDRTILRYTDFENPFVSQAENTIPLNKGDLSNIISLGVQDDLVCAFKDSSIWIVALTSPADDTTWEFTKVPGNMGIVGVRAVTEVPNGLLFVGKLNGRISGLHILSGIDIAELSTGPLRTLSISERIESDVLAFPSAGWSNIVLCTYNYKTYMACAKSGDTTNSHIYWFDINRLGGEGQPGSWSLWDGLPCQANTLIVHNSTLYAGSSNLNGRVIQLEAANTYSDAGAAINSYFWTKEYGGEAELDSWIKDFRKVNLWYGLQGDWFMNLRYRVDGDTSEGSPIPIDLDPGGSLWGTAIWGTVFLVPRTDYESQMSISPLLGRRIQLRFDNQNTAGQSFKVNRMKVLYNLRRQR